MDVRGGNVDMCVLILINKNFEVDRFYDEPKLLQIFCRDRTTKLVQNIPA